jgi:hypothetical protein
MLDLGLTQDRLFGDYFAEPAIADVFGLHVLFSFSARLKFIKASYPWQ